MKGCMLRDCISAIAAGSGRGLRPPLGVPLGDWPAEPGSQKPTWPLLALALIALTPIGGAGRDGLKWRPVSVQAQPSATTLAATKATAASWAFKSFVEAQGL